MATISLQANIDGSTTPNLGNRFLPTGLFDDSPVYSNRSRTWFLWYDRQGEGWSITTEVGVYPTPPGPYWTREGTDPQGIFNPQGTATGDPTFENRDPVGSLAGKFSGSTVYTAPGGGTAMRNIPRRHTRGPQQITFGTACRALADLWWEELTVELHDEWLEYADGNNNSRRKEVGGVPNGWLSFVHSGMASIWHGESARVVTNPRISASCELATLFAYRTSPNTIQGTLTSIDPNFPAPETLLFVYHVYPGKQARPGSRFQTHFAFAYDPDDDSPGPFEFTGAAAFSLAPDDPAFFFCRYHRGLSPTQAFFRSLTWLDP